MFLAVGRIPDHPEARSRAAQVGNLALADATRMLAGTLPRILLRSMPEGPSLVAALEAEGFLAWAADATEVPSDAARVVVRNLDWEPGGFRVTDAKGASHVCPTAAVRLFQRGARTHAATEIVKTKETRFDLGKAVLSGGLLLTKTVEKVKETTTHAKEPFLLVQRGDGQPDLMIYEHRMNYQCLGGEMRHATLANLGLLGSRLQALCPEAPLDDRVGRPGFVAGLPGLAMDPVDLGLYLVSEARRRGC
jgi:hypothetical protein